MNITEYNAHYTNSGSADGRHSGDSFYTQAQAEPMAPIDLISCLVSDELTLRSDRLLERRRKQAGFRDANRSLEWFRLYLQSEDESQSGL